MAAVIPVNTSTVVLQMKNALWSSSKLRACCRCIFMDVARHVLGGWNCPHAEG